MSSRWSSVVKMTLALALAPTLGCTAYATKKNLPVDCSVMNAYDVDTIDSFFGMMFGANDNTNYRNPDAGVKTAVEAFPDGPLCPDTTGLHVIGLDYNDWGSLFSFYSFPKKNEATAQGLAFWARAPGSSAKGITILLDDPNTKNPSANCGVDSGVPGVPAVIPPGDAGAFCTTYCSPDGGGTSVTAPVYDPATGSTLSSGTSTAPLPANACSNSYQWELTLTSDWKFYTIPFREFQQQGNQDKVPNSALPMIGPTPDTTLLTSSIWWMTFRMPKGAPYELWFDHMGFYRPKGSADGGGQ
ncbi:MAG TPA: hypothetical protein VI456_15725 [Polyangia bacterium]